MEMVEMCIILERVPKQSRYGNQPFSLREKVPEGRMRAGEGNMGELPSAIISSGASLH